ncbi:SDR family NAD(P)-dependent oxidoreductase [bacterium]|nr:SDR family NAD(P)-dependent oxidoreductase [bacterium]MBU1880509.1 SDR family NAD(P)-dependent oxidoreductase [bacterium]
MNPFLNKLVLITGASAGIGRQTALDFADEGAKLLLAARRSRELAETADEASLRNAQVFTFQCDLSDRTARDRLIEQVITSHGIPDILINNAGFGNYQLFTEESIADVYRMMEVNYLAAAHLIHAFLPEMLKRNSGSIVNVSSGAGKVAMPNMASYCATKFALCALTESIAYELHKTGVTIHCVNPGPTETEFFQAGIWKGTLPRRKAGAADVSLAIRDAIFKDKLYSYVPPKRGLMAVVFHLLGPYGRKVLQRKEK